jgi:thiamine pyrophosphate-dependent acetolactate synthase large subunit-like protein
MSEQQTIQKDIDQFIAALEEMMDARDDMWYEEEYHNHRQFQNIKEERYNPAKQKVRDYLEKILQNRA